MLTQHMAPGNLPGYFLGAFCLDRIGRRKLQLIGFGGQVIMYTILATAYDRILHTSVALFMVLFAIAQVFNMASGVRENRKL